MTTQNTSKRLDITVFRGWKESGHYVWSPYVTKLEARLRFAGLSYKTDAGSLKAAPKGKIPYIECNDLSSSSANQQESSQPKILLSDSALIPRTLSEWGVLPDLNGSLDPVKRSHDAGLIALLENKLYFYHAKERWIQNYYTMRDYALWSIPYPIRVLVGLMIYRNTTAMLHGQGTGRFTDEEIAESRREIWELFSALLTVSRSNSKGGDTDPFWVLGGDQPTEVDTCLFGFISSVALCTAAPDSRKVVESLPVLFDYAGRIHDRYFPDYERWSD
ncbi:uncharacterized protein F4822DRAFT_431021 [Hypoxylon trugodes]|uniref:uncharacterized protein n=1 Tax=Hypoxylon trugodes TaxID=326681 RepID=UPI0021932D8C|nr:uncharacterized protein F4822DRAFT_431021 [Hypoxylon trugodes]KAI1386148.1 hypothetical protein F4822DRAFT_431021 [Hypoxylon trugodes]